MNRSTPAWLLFLLAAASPAIAQTQGGLLGEYHNNNSLTAPVTYTFPLDNPTLKNWVNAAPTGVGCGADGLGGAATGLGADNFSIRWRGWIEVPSTGTWTFYINPDDQGRLWINGTQVINTAAANVEVSGTIDLTAGTRYPIMLENVEFGGGAKFLFSCMGPGGTPAKAPVPTSYFWSLAAAPAAPATPTIAPNGGVCPVNNVTLSSTTAGAAIYYTTDGTDPGLSAPAPTATLYTGPFTVNLLTKIRARAYTVPFDGFGSGLLTSNQFSPLYPTVTPPGGTVQNMYFREYASPTGALLPAFATLVPRQRGLVPQPTHLVPPLPARIPDDNNFAYQYTAYLNVPETGMWTFFTTSDDGSRAYVDGVLVVDNNFAQGMTERSGQIALSAGWHTYLVQFAQGGGGFGLEARWQGPVTTAKAIIPATAFATEPIVATPVFAPAAPASFAGSQAVTITCATPGALIYYTTDGSFPDSTLATGAGLSGMQVTLTSTTTLRAVAFAPGLNPSSIVTGVYTRSDLYPTLASVLASGINTNVVVTFNRPVTAATAGNPANYSIDNGVTVSAATLIPKSGTVVGQWSLNASPLVDSTTANANGSLTNATVDAVNFAPLVAGNTASLAFNGTNAFASIPDGAPLEVGDDSFTVTAWIRPATVNTNKRIVNKWDNATSVGWYLDLESTTFRFRLRDTGGRDSNFTFGSTIAANAWSFVAARFDAERKQMTVFLNGTQIGGIGNANVASDDLSNIADLGIGAIPSVLGNYFSGNIDEIKLWRISLSDEEIRTMATGVDTFTGSVRLTTSAVAPNIVHTLTARNVADYFGAAIPAGGITRTFQYFPTGTVRMEFYEGIGGGNVADFTRNAIYPFRPTSAAVLTVFENDTNLDNFGGRTRGYFIPPSSGNWRLASTSDDAAQLWRSTNEDPANKILISRNTAWSNYRDYADPDILQSVPIPLVAGQKYYIEQLFKEGGGGDHMSVAAIPDTGAAIPANQASIPAGQISPIQPSLAILQQPQGISAVPGGTITLSVLAQGTAPLTYQWRKNGTAIPGATSYTLTLSAVTLADSGNYDVVVTDALGTITSSIAVVGIIDSTAAPTISAIAPPHGRLAGGDTVTITGTNLLPGVTTITIGGAPATSVTFLSTTQVSCVTPAGAAGTVNVVVTTPGGSATLTNGFTYWAAPTLTLVDGGPTMGAFGPLAGGNTVTLTGTNFVAGYTSVTFDGTAATSVNVTATTTLTCVVPAHAAGVVNVAVTAPGGGPVVLTNSYEYVAAPTAASITPTDGPLVGGDAFTVAGTNLIPSYTRVLFAANAATGVTVNGLRTSLTGSTPAGAAAVNVAVTVVTPGGTTAAITGGYTYYTNPTLTSIDIANGPEAGGQTVVLTGTNLVAGTTTVTFGGAAATITASSATQITVTTPPGTGLVNVTVTTRGGSSTLTNAYRYHPIPTATSMDITSGPTIGGTTITITGSGFFTGVTTVTFGGIPGTAVNVTSSTTLTVQTPSSPPGSFNVVVTTPGGQATIPTQFTFSGPFISTITPNAGLITGGNSVTIGGFGFTGVTSVTFGGTAAAITSSSATQIVVTVPAHAVGPVLVVVQTPGGNDDLPAGYTYFDLPTLTTVSPVVGPTIGGQTVTLTGTNFVPGFTTVTFGGTAATGIAIGGGNTTLTCTTPAHVAGLVDVVVTTFGTQTATLAGSYTFVQPPTLVSVVPNRGPTGGGQTVTLSGSDFVPGFTAVTFGGTPAAAVTVLPGGASLTCTTPAGAGTVAVQVTTFGSQTATLPAAYTYVNPATTVDLELTQAVSNLAPNVGDDITFTLTLSNPGGVGATNVVVTDLLPVGLTFKTAAPTQGTYVPATGAWTVGSLGVSGTASLVLVATLNTSGLVTHTAEVTSVVESDVDSTPANGIVGEDDLVTVSFQATLTLTTPAALPDVTSGAFYWQPIGVTGGSPPYSWSLVSGTLPFNLDPSTGLISGIAPAATGAYVFTLQVSDSDSPSITATRTFTINVLAANGAAASVNADPVPPPGTIGSAYDHTFTAINGDGTYTWAVTAGAVPTGLLLDPVTGRLAGTPTATGTFNFTLQATGSGGPGSRAFSITVSAAPLAFVTAGLPGGSVGSFYSHGVDLQGGLGPVFTWSVSAGALPTGLALSGTGRRATISGTPTANGSFTFTLQAIDTGPSGLTVTRPFTVVIAAGASAFEFTTQDLPAGTEGVPYSATLAARGGTRPYTFSITSGVLPAGLTLNGLTGAIAGTPTAAGRFELQVRVVDFVGAADSGPLTLDISPAPFLATPSPLPGGVQGRPYAVLLEMGAGRAPATWAVSAGALPAGLALDAFSGMISGTPSANGAFTFDVTLTDASGAQATAPYSLTITAAGTLVALVTLPQGQVGIPYAAVLAASGGTPPYTWSVTAGTLPAWATLDAALGTITGTPTVAGSTPITLQVSGGGTASTGSINLVVLDTLVVNPPTIAGAIVGIPYTQALTATGASGTVTWAVVAGSLPAGLSLDAATGVISGTPASASGTFRVRATDALGRTAERRYTIGAGAPAPGVAGPKDGSGGNNCSLASADAGAIHWTWALLAVIMLATLRRYRGA